MSSQHDCLSVRPVVVVAAVGAGGWTAAIGLARSGFCRRGRRGGQLSRGRELRRLRLLLRENLAHRNILGPAPASSAGLGAGRLVERGLLRTPTATFARLRYREPRPFANATRVCAHLSTIHLAADCRQLAFHPQRNHGVESLDPRRGRVKRCSKRSAGPPRCGTCLMAEGDRRATGHARRLRRAAGSGHDAQKSRSFSGHQKRSSIGRPAPSRRFSTSAETSEGVAYEMLLPQRPPAPARASASTWAAFLHQQAEPVAGLVCCRADHCTTSLRRPALADRVAGVSRFTSGCLRRDLSLGGTGAALDSEKDETEKSDGMIPIRRTTRPTECVSSARIS